MSDQKKPAEELRAFFERFQSLSAASDVERIAAMYAGSVMIAGPRGSQVVSAADLQRAIPMRRQLLESAGYQDTALVGFEETALTDRYALVRAQFRWQFKDANLEPITVTLPSTFVVDRGGDAPRIVVYMNEQDVVSVLRDRGVLPPAS
jgi:ketosteroid isomerase-like protein